MKSVSKRFDFSLIWSNFSFFSFAFTLELKKTHLILKLLDFSVSSRFVICPLFIHLIYFLLNLVDFLLNVVIAFGFFQLTNNFLQVVNLVFGFFVLKFRLFYLFPSSQDLLIEFFFFVGLFLDFSWKINKFSSTSCIDPVLLEADLFLQCFSCVNFPNPRSNSPVSHYG